MMIFTQTMQTNILWEKSARLKKVLAFSVSPKLRSTSKKVYQTNHCTLFSVPNEGLGIYIYIWDDIMQYYSALKYLIIYPGGSHRVAGFEAHSDRLASHVPPVGRFSNRCEKTTVNPSKNGYTLW